MCSYSLNLGDWLFGFDSNLCNTMMIRWVLFRSVCVCNFTCRPDETYALVGTAKDLSLNPRSCAGGFIHTYKIAELIDGGYKLEFVHKVRTSYCSILPIACSRRSVSKAQRESSNRAKTEGFGSEPDPNLRRLFTPPLLPRSARYRASTLWTRGTSSTLYEWIVPVSVSTPISFVIRWIFLSHPRFREMSNLFFAWSTFVIIFLREFMC